MVRIEIVADIKKKMKEDNAYVKAVLGGKKQAAKAEKTIVVTPKIFSKIFSPQRINLLLEIKHSKQKNIYQIAKSLGRSYEAVHRDIKLLQGFSIIKVKSEQHRKFPTAEPIQIPIFSKA